MICQHCQRSLRRSDGLKCSICESEFHLKCVSGKDPRECGDRGYQWKCALCHTSANKTPENSKENLINAINFLTEKFEVVNNIKLPQLNTELRQIKSATDRIVKQNDDLLHKIDEFEKRKNCESKSRSLTQSYRKRNLNFSQRSRKSLENNDCMPISSPSTAQNTARYYTHRRSYLLTRMFHLLNRKSNKANVKTPTKKY